MDGEGRNDMSFKKKWGLCAVAAAALLAAPALAQDDIYDEDFYDDDAGLTNDIGVTVLGGLNTYTGDIGDATGAGAFLGVQADSRPYDLVGVELGYQGSRNPFEDIDGALWRHNVGALAKVGPQLGQNDNLRPFVGAGIGVSVLNPSEDAEFLYDTDFVTEVPLAAGVEYDFGGIVAGARATYRLVGGEDLGLDEDGNLVNFGLQVGGNF
jgi:Outer membrane protein beta-barrel domain